METNFRVLATDRFFLFLKRNSSCYFLVVEKGIVPHGFKRYNYGLEKVLRSNESQRYALFHYTEMELPITIVHFTLVKGAKGWMLSRKTTVCDNILGLWTFAFHVRRMVCDWAFLDITSLCKGIERQSYNWTTHGKNLTAIAWVLSKYFSRIALRMNISLLFCLRLWRLIETVCEVSVAINIKHSFL